MRTPHPFTEIVRSTSFFASVISFRLGNCEHSWHQSAASVFLTDWPTLMMHLNCPLLFACDLLTYERLAEENIKVWCIGMRGNAEGHMQASRGWFALWAKKYLSLIYYYPGIMWWIEPVSHCPSMKSSILFCTKLFQPTLLSQGRVLTLKRPFEQFLELNSHYSKARSWSFLPDYYYKPFKRWIL